MNFGFNDEQTEIKSTARQFLENRFKPSVVRELAEAGRYDEGLWKEICELGWAGIALDDEHGGQGLGMVELVILCEELGYACAPTPFLANACAGLALEWAGSDAQQEGLAGIAAGDARGAVGSPEAFIDAEGAAVPIVFDEDGARILDPDSMSFERIDAIDQTRGYSKPSSVDGEPLPGDVDAASQRICVAAAAELVGIGQRALDMAVEYAKDRHQFERPIGAYQAVSHNCAGMLYDVEEARSLTYYAAWAADAQPESLPMAAAMAKARASDAAWEITKASLQVHAGIGFTWEHDLHFLLKRARAGAQLFGTAAQHRDRVAGLAGMGSGN
ncbi:MAG TPA: acyl-CoA dehydrogenase family protein [Solirubrobacterales bacterium]|nr:acyl-CoA dehydrogenase family protein [Solirubrobacterales bacterium]